MHSFTERPNSVNHDSLLAEADRALWDDWHHACYERDTLLAFARLALSGPLPRCSCTPALPGACLLCAVQRIIAEHTPPPTPPTPYRFSQLTAEDRRDVNTVLAIDPAA